VNEALRLSGAVDQLRGRWFTVTVMSTDDLDAMQALPRAGSPPTTDALFRNLHGQLAMLTGQADLKASIVITAASITLSLAATRISDSALRPGAITLGVFVLAALVCAIFSVLPKYKLTGQPPASLLNPLFFGHVGLLDREEYRGSMRSLVDQPEALLDAMIDDLHAQSSYLLRSKFRPLRWAYMSLLVGFFAAAIAQTIAEIVR
jgi:Family of unknown function (DUF5706)